MPTNYATFTANTLSRSSMQQIIDFLRSSMKHGTGHLTLMERETLNQAAKNLEMVLSWQREEA